MNMSPKGATLAQHMLTSPICARLLGSLAHYRLLCSQTCGLCVGNHEKATPSSPLGKNHNVFWSLHQRQRRRKKWAVIFIDISKFLNDDSVASPLNCTKDKTQSRTLSGVVIKTVPREHERGRLTDSTIALVRCLCFRKSATSNPV